MTYDTDRLVGLITGGAHGDGEATKSILAYYTCIKGSLDGPPLSFVLSSTLFDYYEYADAVEKDTCLCCIGLSLMSFTSDIYSACRYMTSTNIDAMAMSTMCVLINTLLSTDCLYNILPVINETIRRVVRRFSHMMTTAEYNMYIYKCNIRHDALEYNDSAIDVMAACVWSMRELNRRLTRWEIDTSQEAPPDYTAYYTDIVVKFTPYITYIQASGCVLGAVLGRRYVYGSASLAETVDSILTLHER